MKNELLGKSSEIVPAKYEVCHHIARVVNYYILFPQTKLEYLLLFYWYISGLRSVNPLRKSQIATNQEIE